MVKQPIDPAFFKVLEEIDYHIKRAKALEEELEKYRFFGSPSELIELQQMKIILAGTAHILGMRDHPDLTEVPKYASRAIAQIEELRRTTSDLIERL
jgi:hypothetical protein